MFINKILIPIMATAVILYGSNSLAGPSIGFKTGAADPDFAYADLWTNETDSALSVGFQPATLIPPNAPYTTTLISQSRVGGLSLNGGVLSISQIGCELNVTCEITKVIKFDELVIANDGTNATFRESPGQSNGVAELKIYFDDTPDADPTSGTGYDDGTLIMSAQLLSVFSSFAATGNIGTGSFDLQFLIDFADPNFIDTQTQKIIGERITGTTNVPSFFTPPSMWDGTSTTNNLLLKVDSSQSFVPKPPTEVPEPLSFFLSLLALMSLSAVEHYKKSRN